MLILNMGGEMIYVLDQRLRAQSIPLAKSQKVLADVIKTMHFGKFIMELFKPQEPYSSASLRQIFDKLAHSSIMRLNESSMDKLVDLMAMGFKYQLVYCSFPEELLEVTINHLEASKALVKSPIVANMIDVTISLCHTAYDRLTPAEFALLRQTLAAVFQDRRVKVSIFLQDGLQSADGAICVPVGGPLAYGAERPGVVKYIDKGVVHRTVVLDPAPVKSDEWLPPTAPSRLSAVRWSKLGLNLYAKERPSAHPKPAAAANTQTAPAARDDQTAGTAAAKPPVSPEVSSRAVLGELNHLASLLGQSAASDSTADNFSLNLFADRDPFSISSPHSQLSSERGAPHVVMDARSPHGHRGQQVEALRQRLDRDFALADGGPGSSGQGKKDEDDLLDLMDAATSKG
ncbi:unnamed protein product [Vitrella brassicaformis CCMP3155]|uniref:Protein OSCP1 n=1 Tax=Vitrella brassicaformis (strain CCMP3155) TaxID=1169540 RepID=A0A0G4G9Y2_VITBC|nr:unnamed protein product [Vitrella brassicaformis CCMP3155]|eukprot:CEM25755.1 unnamed protein product [Vitrella brassicaformis CCMP3155]